MARQVYTVLKHRIEYGECGADGFAQCAKLPKWGVGIDSSKLDILCRSYKFGGDIRTEEDEDILYKNKKAQKVVVV